MMQFLRLLFRRRLPRCLEHQAPWTSRIGIRRIAMHLDID